MPVNATSGYEMDFSEKSKEIMGEVFEVMKENNLGTEEERIEALTGYFLELPYVADRLVGSNTEAEKLVIALNELDCFTYIDYVEAFKRSTDEESFIQNLKKIRYIDGQVNYLNRKHFFSDWFAENEKIVEDVLKQPQYKDVVDVKNVSLNQGANGPYIPGLDIRERDIYAIPRENVTEEILKTFKTGDYVGLATNIPGLDVTHTVIVIQKEDGTYMRHASSSKSNMKVVDEKIIDYVQNVKSVRGLLVFRSLEEMKPLEGTLTIEYVDENSNKLRENTTETMKIQESFKLDAPTVKGYEPTKSTIEGKLTDANQTIQFVYQKEKVVIPNQELPTTGAFPIATIFSLSSVGLGSLLLMINKIRKD